MRALAPRLGVIYIGGMFEGVSAPPRRVEALAYIVERIERSGTSPSYGEIGSALRPRVSAGRARQYVDELVRLGVIERPLASRRGIQIHDWPRCRAIIQEALGRAGWCQARPGGALEPHPYTIEQLPLIRLVTHSRDVT